MRKISKVSVLLPLICLFLIGCTASTSYGQTGQDEQPSVEIDVNLVQLTMNCTQNFLPGEVVQTYEGFEFRSVAFVSLKEPFPLELTRFSVREVGSECEFLFYGHRSVLPAAPYDPRFGPGLIQPYRRWKPILNELILPLEQTCIRNAAQASQLELCRQQAIDEFIRNSIFIYYLGGVELLTALFYEGNLYSEEGPLQ